MSSDDTGGTGPVTGGTPRPTRSGPGIGSTLSIIVAAVAVILGFFILRDINDDGGTGSGGGESAETTTTVAEPTSTTASSATSSTLVTTGFTVVVANASGVSGSAGQMSTYLESQGFDVAEPTNAASSVGQLATTQVYYLSGQEPGAQSVAIAMGLDPVTVQAMPSQVPTETGSLGDASVLVLLGTDLAGKEIGTGSETTTTTAAATETTVAPATTG